MDFDKKVIEKFGVSALELESSKAIGPEEQVSFWRDPQSERRYVLFCTDHLSESEDVGSILAHMAKIDAKNAIKVKPEHRPQDVPAGQELRSDTYRTHGADSQVYELWELPN